MSRPPDTSEEFLLPHEVRVGDLFQFRNDWHPVRDMVTRPGGGRILHFDDLRPYSMTQAEIVARPISHADARGSLGRLLGP
ncbi:hypothetical protein ACFQ64_04245 [Streptomyces sp. NPDC056460]|uniref:hypothetical protein n=1 Tax=Streptomyces sp. NPDC056460 TaxID=3345825 RepID=UPI0036927948